MKKLSSLIALGIFALSVIAKPTFHEDQFKNYATQMQVLTQKYLDANETDNAAKVVDKWIADYYKLSAAHQKKMKAELAQFYFTQSRVYARQNNTDKAVRAMKDAIQSGFSDYNAALNSPELASVRSDSEFAKLLESIKG